MAEQGTAIVPTLMPLQRIAATSATADSGRMRRVRELGRAVCGRHGRGRVTDCRSTACIGELEIYVSEVGTDADAGDPGRDGHGGPGARHRRQPWARSCPARMADLIAVDGDPSERIGDLRQCAW